MQFGYWLQDLAAKATLFSRRGDHATAARLYETMIAVVPERAIGHVLLCQEYEALREPRQAINACGDALLVDGAQVKDYLHFVGLLLAQPGDLSPKEILVLDQVLKHMRDEPAAKDVADEVECEIGTRTMNLTYLETCTTNLAATAPDDVKTITFQWTYAIGRGRFGEAETLVERAKAKGVGASTLEQMQRKMLEERERSRKRMAAWAGAILLALATVILGGRELSRRLKAARRASAPPPEAPSPSTLAAPDVTPGAAP
jgi:hypothetical protein